MNSIFLADHPFFSPEKKYSPILGARNRYCSKEKTFFCETTFQPSFLHRTHAGELVRRDRRARRHPLHRLRVGPLPLLLRLLQGLLLRPPHHPPRPAPSLLRRHQLRMPRLHGENRQGRGGKNTNTFGILLLSTFLGARIFYLCICQWILIDCVDLACQVR